MSYSMIRRSVVLLILAVVMAGVSASSAQAAGLGWQQLAGELGQAAWAWLAGAAMGGHIQPGNVKPKIGCSIDPQGNPLCKPMVIDHGCSIDPAGKPICDP